MYQEKIVIKSEDVDNQGELKLSRLLYFMQEIAGAHAEKLHIGRDTTIKDGNIWVVVRGDIKINRMPRLKEKIVISTHPGETKGFMFPRFFQVYDKHNNLLVTASSTWVIINFETRKIVLRPFQGQEFPFESDPSDLPLPIKVNEEAPNLVMNRATKENEVDVNKHINNTYYYDYVLDVHDETFYKENRVSRLVMNFEKEIIHPSDIEIYSSKTNPEVVIGKVGGNISFASKVEFSKR